jgi:hypothetical protein
MLLAIIKGEFRFNYKGIIPLVYQIFRKLSFIHLMSTRINVHTCTYIHLYKWTYIHVYIYSCIHVYMNICIQKATTKS